MAFQVTFLCGPTASGKSDFAIKLAQKKEGVIVNSDAMQVYKDIPLITFSPNKSQKNIVPHMLYNYIDLESDYSVKHYIDDVNRLLSTSDLQNKPIYIVGGNGFYMHSLIFGLDVMPQISPETIELVNHHLQKFGLDEIIAILKKVDPEFFAKKKYDKYRVIRAYSIYCQTKKPFSSYLKQEAEIKLNLEGNYKILLLLPDRGLLYNLCNERSKKLLETDYIEEIRSLINRPIFPKFVSKVIGIKEILDYINSKISYDEALHSIQIRTRHYAKRQITWFKRYINMPECMLIKDIEGKIDDGIFT